MIFWRGALFYLCCNRAAVSLYIIPVGVAVRLGDFIRYSFHRDNAIQALVLAVLRKPSGSMGVSVVLGLHWPWLAVLSKASIYSRYYKAADYLYSSIGISAFLLLEVSCLLTLCVINVGNLGYDIKWLNLQSNLFGIDTWSDKKPEASNKLGWKWLVPSKLWLKCSYLWQCICRYWFYSQCLLSVMRNFVPLWYMMMRPRPLTILLMTWSLFS